MKARKMNFKLAQVLCFKVIEKDYHFQDGNTIFGIHWLLCVSALDRLGRRLSLRGSARRPCQRLKYEILQVESSP